MIHGSSQTISEMQSRTSLIASRSTGGMLWNSPRIFEARVESMRSLARNLLSGGRATERSLKISTSKPPAPKVMTGPKIGSRKTPTISSRPLGRDRKGSIETPLILAFGCRLLTVSMMS